MKNISRIVIVTMLGWIALAMAGAQQGNEARPVLNAGSGRYYTGVSPIEVRFPTAMVSSDVLESGGAASSPIAISPALEGAFTWRSQRSGIFTLSEVPPLSTSFAVSTAPGVLDADGGSVPEVLVGNFVTESARIVSQYPRYFASHEIPRQLSVTYFFNTEVDLESARKSVRFVDENGVMVLANVRHPLGKELPDAKIPIGNRAQQFRKERPEIHPDTVIQSALTISPSLSLPEGDGWKVVWEPIVTEGNRSTAANKGRLMGNVPAFLVSGNHFRQRYDTNDTIEVTFNKQIASDMTVEKLMRWVNVVPEPEGMSVSIAQRSFQISGEFEKRDYKVSVAKGLPAQDGTLLKQYDAKTHVVKPLPPHLSVPAFGAMQYGSGEKTFDVIAANISQVHIRVKQVAPRDAARAMAAYELYRSSREKRASNDKSKKEQMDYVPFQVIPGKTVGDKVYKSAVDVDQSDKFAIDWDGLLGRQVDAALLFVSIEGTIKPGVEMDNAPVNGTMIAQSLLQITDIGLAWKRMKDDVLVYAFSQHTGKPMSEVVLNRYDLDASAIGTRVVTDEQGMATVPVADARWLVARNGRDAQAVAFGAKLPLVNMWQFGVPLEWRSLERKYREAHLFTDRPLYRPEETVHLKCMTRMVQGSEITLPEHRVAKLNVYDPEGRLHSTEEIRFTERGSYAGSLELPGRDTGLGAYRIEISFVDPEEEGGRGRDRSFDHYVYVQEFKANAFAVTMDKGTGEIDSDRHTFPLSAKYLMGKALAKSKVTWSATIRDSSFRSDRWPGFVFGDARSGWIYDGDGYREYEAVTSRVRSHSMSGNTELDDSGSATVVVPVAAQLQFPSRRTISLTASVTDINQQTISASTSKVVESSDFYLGLRLEERVLRVGQTSNIEFAAVKVDDSQYSEKLQAAVKIEKINWNSIKIEGAGGAVTMKNFLSLSEVSTESIALQPGSELALPFTPKSPGTFVITATCDDGQGRPVVSALTVTAYGAGDVYWHQRDGIRVELEADKESYLPGEEAMVVVKSAIHGPALVTVERDTVRQQFTTEITSDAHAIPIKIDTDDTPNVFVSVLLVRGGADSPKKFPRPEYRIGYCELTVKNIRDGLDVTVASDTADYRPGQPISASATVTDSSGAPTPNAEVTLYAVDQGVLDLMPYALPDPFRHFHQPQRLAVKAGSSLGNLLAENPDDRDFGNKGVIIGGGGMMALPKGQMRKNFKACAFWSGDLITDFSGRVTAKFDAPDNLTEYHVFAIATEGAARFGGGEASFKINKPIMLEPGLPRFANVGDRIVAKAVVHNTSGYSGEFRVELALDETAEHVDAELEPVRRRKVLLSAGQSVAVSFPVAMVAVGEANWDWVVKPEAADEAESAELVDGVESRFAVTWPVPEFHESHYKVVSEAAIAENMLADVDPEFLEGDGRIELTVSVSPLINAKGAIEQVLQYPYGCIEQTTSSTLPWIGLRDLRSALPSLNKTDTEIADAIRAGCKRILSMQTRSGGLGYWPGADQPMLWGSSYAGMALALAQKQGVSLSQSRIDRLCAYLSSQLRDSGKDTDQRNLTDRCLAAYTLALFGKAQPAYHSVLRDKAVALSGSGRSFLAMAILHAGGADSKAQAQALLEMPQDESGGRSYHDPANAAALLAWCKLEASPKTLAAKLRPLIGGRSLRGDWNNTYLNGWSLLALGDYSRVVSAVQSEVSLEATFLGETKLLELNPVDKLSARVLFPFKRGDSLDKLQLQLPDGIPLYTIIDVTAQPRLIPQKNRSSGDFTLFRSYEELAPDGTRSAPTELEIGDLVVVKLEGRVTSRSEYIVIDDALPAIFEAINPDFGSRAAATKIPRGSFRWYSDHHEMRAERTLYFRNYVYGGGAFAIEYLVRVIADGTVTAPPAKIEAMYDPGKMALSDSVVLTTMNASN